MAGTDGSVGYQAEPGFTELRPEPRNWTATDSEVRPVRQCDRVLPGRGWGGREAGIRPDLVIGTSVGAINGAAIAADPTVGAVARLGELWGSLGRSGVFSGSVLQNLRLAAHNRTHVCSSAPLRVLLEARLPARRIEDLAVPFQCVAASIESAAEHWFTQGPLIPAVSIRRDRH
ncbi:patatin-like phospholipase family protein [Streptomyces sp. NPDC020719]|uniref:patatin-like phospholipase family protein n=1 Tax=Streptomyces sp. NPDC020719 TaxID=3154896 RepID=UPI0033FC615F